MYTYRFVGKAEWIIAQPACSQHCERGSAHAPNAPIGQNQPGNATKATNYIRKMIRIGRRCYGRMRGSAFFSEYYYRMD